MSINDNALIIAPFGAISIAAQDDLLAIELLAPTSQSQALQVLPQVEKASSHPLVQLACQQIMQYLQQPSTAFNLPLAPKGTAFQQRVWQAIAAIPCGQTRTYGEIARQLGSGPRAIANACGANPLPLVIPCHRVVAQNGIGGFMQGKQDGLMIKQWLLLHEGVKGFGRE